MSEIGSGRRIPRYAMRTVATSAPEFVNHEQDMIRQSFSTGNYTWMKDALPVEIGPDSVNLLRRQRMERNRLAEDAPKPFSKMSQLWGGGYYQEFEYIPDEYERKRDFETGERQISLEKREKICTHDWRYSSQERRMKHETMIQDHGVRGKEGYPYLGGDHDAELEASKQWLRGGGSSMRSGGQWSQEPSQLAGESSFLAGRGKGLEDGGRSSRMTLPTIVLRLQKRVDADWEGTTVVVCATHQDLIQIAFHMDTVDSERGVLAYMGVLSKDVDLLGTLGLRKVSQLWGMKRDFSAEMSGVEGAPVAESLQGEKSKLEHVWMFFLLAPKWVRMRPTDAYYTVHPRSQGSAFRMSTAGSSVLLSLGTSVFDPAESKRKDLSARGLGSHNASSMDSARGMDDLAYGGQHHAFGSPGSAGAGAAGLSAASPSPRSPPRMDISMLEQAVSGLPAIKEPRGGGGLSARPRGAR